MSLLFYLEEEKLMDKLLFENLDLSQEVMKAIESMNFTEATEIQAGAIPHILAGLDVIGRSNTGTGKTAAFGIPAVESIDHNINKPQVLVLCPTRELAMQTTEEMRKFSKYKPCVKVASVYGGQSMDIQIRQLRTANIVIGTPGRIMDHMRRRTLKLDDIKMVVLDEADEMLNMGFYDDIKTILTDVPEERQTVLFSATMPPAILKITKEFQKDPQTVTVDKGQRTLTSIAQFYYHVPMGKKMDAINLLLQMHEPKRSIVFCNTKAMVDELVIYLNEHGFKSVGIHGDMRQAVRSNVMENFKTGKISILVATDVAARGIDVENIETVFNFDIPQDYEYYIHRIGRTGRAGKLGAAFTLTSNPKQLRIINEIKRFINADIIEKPIPSVDDIMNKKQDKFIAKIKKALDEDTYEQNNYYIDRFVSEGYDLKQIASCLLNMAASKDKKFVPVIKSAPVESYEVGKSDSPKVNLQVNIGRNQKIAPNFIVGAIVEATGLPAKAIGKIEIFDDHTTVEMNSQSAQVVVSTMQNSKIRGNVVTFTITERKSTPNPNNFRPRNDFAKRQDNGYRDKRNDFKRKPLAK